MRSSRWNVIAVALSSFLVLLQIGCVQQKRVQSSDAKEIKGTGLFGSRQIVGEIQTLERKDGAKVALVDMVHIAPAAYFEEMLRYFGQIVRSNALAGRQTVVILEGIECTANYLVGGNANSDEWEKAFDEWGDSKNFTKILKNAQLTEFDSLIRKGLLRMAPCSEADPWIYERTTSAPPHGSSDPVPTSPQNKIQPGGNQPPTILVSDADQVSLYGTSSAAISAQNLEDQTMAFYIPLAKLAAEESSLKFVPGDIDQSKLDIRNQVRLMFGLTCQSNYCKESRFGKRFAKGFQMAAFDAALDVVMGMRNAQALVAAQTILEINKKVTILLPWGAEHNRDLKKLFESIGFEARQKQEVPFAHCSEKRISEGALVGIMYESCSPVKAAATSFIINLLQQLGILD
jgi:hypothetical protein